MKSIDVDCPHCGCSCDLRLDEDTQVVLLVCPSCGASLVSYYGQTFQVEPSEFRYLRQRGGMKEAQGALRVKQRSSRLPVAVHSAGEPVMDHAVGADEILELHTTLHQCQSIDEFLKALE
ncbi:MAG: hypothetical protein IPK50_19070 [Fibrobacterota bacterium]|nr:hypothetical protein [Fibrobacterota bacterium]QQS04368.1 MAG: hypothetical protein IPK50_19070 [Fibrobacterota bacterium]